MFTIFVRLTLSLFLTISLFACQNNNSQHTQDKINSQSSILSASNDSLYHHVVFIHDEVMPLNSNILALQQKLKKQVGQLDTENNTELLNILSQLQKAYDGMMTWMHEFKNLELHADDYQKWSESETEKYLKAEESKIKDVAQIMRQSLAAATAFSKKIESLK